MTLTSVVLLLLSAVSFGQPDQAERRALLEERREMLADRLAQIDAELGGEVPAGTVSLWTSPPSERFVDGRLSRRPDPSHREIDPQTREMLLEQLAEREPELAKKIRDSMDEHGDRPGPVFGRIKSLLELRERDEEGFQVRREEIQAGLAVLRAAGNLRDLLVSHADEAELEDATSTLRAAVERGFDAKEAVLRLELERQQSRVEEMSGRLDHATSKRTDIISTQFEMLLARVERAANEGEKLEEPASERRLRNHRARGDR